MTDNKNRKALESYSWAKLYHESGKLPELDLGEVLKLVEHYEAENERLEANLKEASAEIEALKLINLHCKAETAKEFAKFLIDKAENGVIAIVDLPDYVREKVGES